MWKNYGVARNSTVQKAVCKDKENVLAIGSNAGNYKDPNWYQKTWTSSVVSLPISNQPDTVGQNSYLSMGGRCLYCGPDNNFIQYNIELNSPVLSTYRLDAAYTTNIFTNAECGYLTDDNFYWSFDSGPYSLILVLPVSDALPKAYIVKIDYPPNFISARLLENAPDGRLFGVFTTIETDVIFYNMFTILPKTSTTVNILNKSSYYAILDIRYVSDQYVYVAYNNFNPPISNDLYVWVGPIEDIDLSKGIQFPKQRYIQSLYSNQNLYVITEQNNTISNRFGLYTIPVSGTTNIGRISLPTEPSAGVDVDNNDTPGWQSPPVPVNTPNLTFYNWINCVMMYNNATKEVGVAVGLNVSKTIYDGKTTFKYTADTIFYALCKDGECVDVVKNRVPCTKQPKRNLCASRCMNDYAGLSANCLPLAACTDSWDSTDCENDVWGKCSDTDVSISQYINKKNIVTTFIPNGKDTDPRNYDSFYDCDGGPAYTIYGSLQTIKDFYQTYKTVENPDPSLDNLCMMNPVFKSNINPNSTTYQPFVCDYTLCVANRQVPILDVVALRGNLNEKYSDPTVGDTSSQNHYLSVTEKEVQDNIDSALLAECTTLPAVHMQNPKCQIFCSTVSGDTKRRCDDAVIEYCKSSGPSVFCSCLQSKQFLSECLDYSCTNNGDSYYTQKVQDFLAGTKCPSVCQTVIEVNKTGGNVNIDNNTFEIKCSNSPSSSGLESSGLAATAAATPSLNKWYGVGSNGKCGEIPGLDYSKSSEYRDCIAQNNKDYAKCEQDLLTSLKIPKKYYSSILDCEKANSSGKANSSKYTFFLAFAIVSFVVAIFMVSFGVVQKKKAFWATGIGFVVVAIGLTVAATT